ncbi:hypothetical protein LX36DRAFT_662484 [Colletotrichum falcatum]|nr:hypothetical protein LX36DRAFT_662484 [Colletotrichum falcatum]
MGLACPLSLSLPPLALQMPTGHIKEAGKFCLAIIRPPPPPLPPSRNLGRGRNPGLRRCMETLM